MTQFTQAQVIDLLKKSNPQKFKKFGTFQYEVSDKEQEVITEVGGKVETKNTAKIGDYIMTGISGEKYVLSPEKFAKRYKDLGNGSAEATGECYGAEYTHLPIEFTANWGEKMICEPGDYLVSPDAEFSQAYRIAREEFFKTYKPA